MGWTYTKINRCVTEGRRALLERLGAIESGAECARWLPRLSALADGEASASDVAELRPHLRACPACRATLRELHAVPAQVALLVPPARRSASRRRRRRRWPGHARPALHALLDRVTLCAARVQGAFEALPGAKVAAVAASTAAIAGGGVALEQATHARPAPPVAAGSPSTRSGLARRRPADDDRVPVSRQARRRSAASGAARRGVAASSRREPSDARRSSRRRAAPRAEFAAAPARAAAAGRVRAAPPGPAHRPSSAAP